MIAAATGHRPHKLRPHSSVDYLREIQPRLIDFTADALRDIGPSKLIIGMAHGFDLAAGLAAMRISLPVIVAVPFKAQYECYPAPVRQQYLEVFNAAERRVLIHKGDFTFSCLQERNEWMVDHADYVIALWNGTEGGTYNCVQYAKKKNKQVFDLWDRWLAFSQNPADEFF